MSAKITKAQMADAVKFVEEQSERLQSFGEITVVFVFHDGKLKRIDKALLVKGTVI